MTTMNSIAFVTDSTACLTREQEQEYGIHVVPLTMIFNGTSYREGRDISPDQFYEKLKATKDFPKTSQPAPGEFVEVFEALQQSHDTVLGLFVSEKLSGTINSARQAAQMVGGDIRIVDSGITSYGMAGPLLDGVHLARQGGTAEDVLQLWESELATMHAYFVVDTLEMLQRGGRIGGAAAAFGSLLQIKPILTIRDGKIDLFEKIRTHRRAMERILSLADESFGTDRSWRVGVVHADREKDAIALKEQLEARYPKVRFEVTELGPVVGCHAGPGVLALLYYSAESLIIRP